MREYELTVIFDLSLAESGGPDAAVEQVTTLVESHRGTVLKTDHWGRRRMAYPINHAVDGDYVVTRIEIDPAEVSPLESALSINERVYRHLVVRADELPAPPPPREARPAAIEAPPESVETPPEAPPAEAPADEAPPAEADEPGAPEEAAAPTQ